MGTVVGFLVGSFVGNGVGSDAVYVGFGVGSGRDTKFRFIPMVSYLSLLSDLIPSIVSAHRYMDDNGVNSDDNDNNGDDAFTLLVGYILGE